MNIPLLNTQFLNTLDIVIIAFYMCSMVAVGCYLKRRATGSMEDYYLAGRKLPWWLLGTSGTLAWFDMTGTMMITSFLFMLGPRGLFIEIRGGVAIVLAFMLCWMGKWNRRSNCMTQAEWMEYRFGKGVGGSLARILMAVSMILFTMGMIAYLVRGDGLFLSMFLPYSPQTCILVMFGITTLYTVLSGFYGVVFTDLVQTFIILVAVILVSIQAYLSVPDVESLAQTAQQVTGNSLWTSALPTWKTEMPKGYEDYQFLLLFAFAYFIRQSLGGMNMGGMPQYFGARSDRDCGLLTLMWTSMLTFRWLMIIGFAVLGIYLVQREFPDHTLLVQAADMIKEHHPEAASLENKNMWPSILAAIVNHPEHQPGALISGLQGLLGENWPARIHLLSWDGTINPERILPAVILQVIPIGLRGLILVALLAASMSTLNFSVNSSCAYFVRDIYQRYIHPTASNQVLVRLSYVTAVLIVLGGYWLGFKAKNINDIWGWLMMGLGTCVQVTGLLRWYWWRFNGFGFAIGTLVGLIAALIQRFMCPTMTELNQFLVVLSLSVSIAIIASLLTPATDLNVLRNFFQTTRPFGFWKPIREGLSEGDLAAIDRESKYDLYSLPFALLWQITMYLLPLQLIIHDYRGMMVTGSLFLTGAIGLYWFWFRNLPPYTADAPMSGSQPV